MAPTRSQVAEFIRAHAIELQKLASREELGTLRYLLEMVVLEADEVLKCANDHVR